VAVVATVAAVAGVAGSTVALSVMPPVLPLVLPPDKHQGTGAGEQCKEGSSR
jgi:hypothetical protein